MFFGSTITAKTHFERYEQKVWWNGEINREKKNVRYNEYLFYWMRGELGILTPGENVTILASNTTRFTRKIKSVAHAHDAIKSPFGM